MRSDNSRLLRYAQYIVFISIILYFGRSLIIPFSFALLVSFVLYPVCRWLESKGTGRMTSIIISLAVIAILGLFVFALLVSQFISFWEEWPSLYAKLVEALRDLSQVLTNSFGVSEVEQSNLLTKISDESSGAILQILRGALTTSIFSLALLVLIPVYTVLILYYRKYWMRLLGRFFPTEQERELKEIVSLTIGAYYNFIKGMAIVYLAVGILNSIGLLVLGVPHAILFGFIASILTFIPYVGIIVGSLLPVSVAWITYDSIWYPLGVVAIFTFVQYLEANVIFPVAVSYRLNVNTLVMLFAIFAGGILWGVPGMILFVPFVGIAKLIADHNPRWEKISMMLGMERQINPRRIRNEN